MVKTLFLLLSMVTITSANSAVLYVSNTCPPCQKAKIIIKQLQNENYDVTISYDFKNKNIHSVPTLIIYSKDKEIKRFVGLQTEQKYRKVIPKKQNYTKSSTNIFLYIRPRHPEYKEIVDLVLGCKNCNVQVVSSIGPSILVIKRKGQEDSVYVGLKTLEQFKKALKGV